MTEQEWLTATTPASMLEHLRRTLGERQISERKLRLFSCLCRRRVWSLLVDERSRKAIEVAELHADSLATDKELAMAHDSARCAAAEVSEPGAADAALAAHVSLDAYPLDAALNAACLAADAMGNDLIGSGEHLHLSLSGWSVEEKAQCDLLRHVFGNPFRPYPTPPSWPADVVQLAEAVYQGADATFALADTLLEAGHPEMAEHFRAEAWHPKGCWVVDAITGRT